MILKIHKLLVYFVKNQHEQNKDEGTFKGQIANKFVSGERLKDDNTNNPDKSLHHLQKHSLAVWQTSIWTTTRVFPHPHLHAFRFSYKNLFIAAGTKCKPQLEHITTPNITTIKSDCNKNREQRLGGILRSDRPRSL